VLSASAGIGYEQITAIPNENDYGEDDKILRSWNVNGGLVLKYYFKADKYFGIHARYNLVNYSNFGGTDISGDYLSLKLVYGGLTTLGKAERRKLLE
jgi:hypothetical protein